jgi:hypothetical protein
LSTAAESSEVEDATVIFGNACGGIFSGVVDLAAVDPMGAAGSL